MSPLAERIADLSDEKRALLAKRLRGQQESGRIGRRTDRDKPIPLSSAQRSVWISDQSSASPNVFNVSVMIAFGAELKEHALRQAIHELVRRHEALRTSIELVDGSPMQIVTPDVELDIHTLSISHTADERPEDIVLSLAQTQDRQPFRLSQAPLLRANLAINGSEPDNRGYILIVTFHHIICDAWSKHILIKELISLYDAFSKGAIHSLPIVPGQYPDYALWEQASLLSGLLRDDLAYWHARLGNTPPPVSFPPDLPLAAMKTGRGGAFVFALEDGLEKELRLFSRTHGITLFMSLLGVLGVLLKHYASTDEVLIGTDTANRQSQETEGMVGFFINQVVLRINLAGNPSFAGLIRHVRDLVIEAYAHQRAPFGKVIESVKPRRIASRAPFFETKLVLENTPKASIELAETAIGIFEVQSNTAEYDTVWCFVDDREEVKARIQYDVAKYTSGLIAHYAAQYEKVLKLVCDNPALKLSGLSLKLSESDEFRKRVDAQKRRDNNLRTLREGNRDVLNVGKAT